jgi:hypothetical protein
LRHIGDRDCEICELFSTTQQVATHFLVRTCVDRPARDDSNTIASEMAKAKVTGFHRAEVRDKLGRISEAVLEMRYPGMFVLRLIGKQKLYPPITFDRNS